MTAVVVRGGAGRLPLPDASVDLIVTSPPYFALRSYTDTVLCPMCIDLKRDGRDPQQAYPDYAEHVQKFHKGHYAGQLGSEATPAAYIAALVACTREWIRVLKPSGSIFVNLGDVYSRPGGGVDRAVRSLAGAGAGTTKRRATPTGRVGGIPEKSLMLLPERYRIACVDDLGLIARAVIVWSKPNGLPESVTDRVRRSHEDWVHLTKQPRYFAAVDEIREPASGYERAQARRLTPGGQRPRAMADTCNPLGKLPGSVWDVATEPLKVPDRLAVDHFAAFPTEWPRRLILGWSPPGVCTACGEGRRPVVVAGEYVPAGHGGNYAATPYMPDGYMQGIKHGHGASSLRTVAARTITGYACACTPYTDHPGTVGDRPAEHARSAALGNGTRDNPGGGYGNAERTGPWREYHFDRWTPPPTRPAVVLDPFGGTGTTAHVAAALGRTGLSVDLSADYCRLAAAPELADARLRKVLGLDKAEPVLAGQMDLLALEEPA